MICLRKKKLLVVLQNTILLRFLNHSKLIVVFFKSIDYFMNNFSFIQPVVIVKKQSFLRKILRSFFTYSRFQVAYCAFVKVFRYRSPSWDILDQKNSKRLSISFPAEDFVFALSGGGEPLAFA